MYRLETNLKETISTFKCFDENDSTTCHCTVEGPFHLPSRSENYSSLVIDVKWRGQDPKVGKYYSHILKSILERFVLLELDASKSICISLYLAGSEKYSLLCGINASLVSLIRIGIPLKGMFYGIQANGKVFVYDEQAVIFYHTVASEQDDVDQKSLFEYTKELVRFSIRDQHFVKI